MPLALALVLELAGAARAADAPPPPPSPTTSGFVLPSPGRSPQAIDFDADPLIAFVAAETPPEAFRAAVAAAVVRHPSYGQAEANTAEARARRSEVRSALFPSINGQLLAARSLARDFGSRTAIVESLQPGSRADLSVGADQLLYDFGATGGRVEGANANVRATRADGDRIATATALRAVAAWYDVLLYQMLGDISDAHVARLQSIVGDTRTLKTSGLGSGGDVSHAEAGLADAVGRAARIERALADSRAAFGEAFGDPPPLRLERPAPPVLTSNTEDAVRSLSHRTPAAMTAAARVEAAEAEARAARGDRLPRLSAGVNGTTYDVFDRSLSQGHDYDVRAQVVLRQSLSLGGAEAARSDQARARARAAEFASETVIAEAERDALAALADSQILDRNVLALRDAYRANRRSRDTTVEQFRLSRGSLLDVLRAEQDFYIAATSYLQGAVERDVARYTLLARTGEILPLFDIETRAQAGDGAR